MEFRDLKKQYKNYKDEIDGAIEEVLLKGNFIGGEEVNQLEEELARYVGIRHCISCANGTDALMLVLMAWGVGKGDAVFVPDFTFFSTAEVVSFLRATPVFVDVKSDTFNLDPEKLEKAIEKTAAGSSLQPKVVIPVDLFGLPADYPQILKVARKFGLKVLEDGAQSFGGSIEDKRACSFGDAAITSFFPAKPLGCYGDGGAVFTGDDHLTGLIRSLKVHGKGSGKYENIRIGVNSRLDTIQAAVLKVKLKALISHELEAVNRVYELYNERLRDVTRVPVVPGGFYSSFAQYTIKLENREQRDGLQAFLKEKGIPSAVYYARPMHRQGAYAHLEGAGEDYKVTGELCDIVLSLPMHPYLSKEEVDTVCEAIRAYLG